MEVQFFFEKIGPLRIQTKLNTDSLFLAAALPRSFLRSGHWWSFMQKGALVPTPTSLPLSLKRRAFSSTAFRFDLCTNWAATFFFEELGKGTRWQISMSPGMLVSTTLSPIRSRILLKLLLAWTGVGFISMLALRDYCSDRRPYDAWSFTHSFKSTCIFSSMKFFSLRDLFYFWTSFNCPFIYS